MAATRFWKPWPCAGIRLGATLSLWRRVHCEHAAWPAWVMVRPGHRFAWQAAGIGRVGGVPRVSRGAVPWGLGSGRVLYTHGQRAFRVAGCGDRACWEVCRGHAAGVLAALCRGDWVPGVSHTRMILRAATCVSRGRCGTSDELMRSGRHWTVDPRGRRNESCAVAKIAGFRGPVRQIACAGARWALRNRGRRRESIRGFADVSLERTSLGT